MFEREKKERKKEASGIMEKSIGDENPYSKIK